MSVFFEIIKIIISDIFGQRVGRVSPRIREIQERLRDAQRKSAIKRYMEDIYVEEDSFENIYP